MILSRSGLELNKIWEQQAALIEFDERLRQLERAHQTGDLSVAEPLAHAYARVGNVLGADRVLANNQPARERVREAFRRSGNHEGLEALHLGPLARNVQRVHMEREATRDKLGRAFNVAQERWDDAAGALHEAARQSLEARGLQPTHADIQLHASRFFDPSHAAPPEEHRGENREDSTLAGQLAAFMGGHRRNTPEQTYRFSVRHPGNHDHWDHGTNHANFKKALDHHGLAKVGKHATAAAETYQHWGTDGYQDEDYSLEAHHDLTLSGQAEEHAQPSHHLEGWGPRHYTGEARHSGTWFLQHPDDV